MIVRGLYARPAHHASKATRHISVRNYTEMKVIHKFVVVLVSDGDRTDIEDSERDTRAEAEGVLGTQLADMEDYMSSFYLTIEERWSIE